MSLQRAWPKGGSVSLVKPTLFPSRKWSAFRHCSASLQPIFSSSFYVQPRLTDPRDESRKKTWFNLCNNCYYSTERSFFRSHNNVEKHTQEDKSKVEEWSAEQVYAWLKENVDPPLPNDLLEGFREQEVTGLALKKVRPAPTLFQLIVEVENDRRNGGEGAKQETKKKISISKEVAMNTLLGLPNYGVQQR
ncbi:hypothetical protein QOT17_019496 [Balamuthia mandrillaris]